MYVLCVKWGKSVKKRVFNCKVSICNKIAKVTSNCHFSKRVTNFLYKIN